jgi:hypothetical protein
MLNRLRERSACLAALLAAFLAAVGSPHSTDPRHDSDRAIVAAGFVAHSETDHRLKAPATDSDTHESHCVMCHFARSFRPRTDTRVVGAASVRPSVYHPAEAVSAPSAALTAQPPLRSPPASPIFV